MIGKSNAFNVGLKDTDAILRVQVLSGSIVTITKSGITKTGMPFSTGGTSDEYYFFISPSQFGTWSVSATKNGATTTTNVTINAAQEYSIILSYNLVILDHSSPASGTWSYHRFGTTYGSGGLTTVSNGIEIYAQWANAQGSTGTTGWYNTLLDLTGYNTLTIEAYSNDTGGKIGIFNSPSTSPSMLAQASITQMATKTYTIDVSSLTSGYVGAYVTSGSSSKWQIGIVYIELSV